MISVTLSLLVLAVIGLLVYALASNEKAGEIGRLVFGCAFLAMCLSHPWTQAAVAHAGR